MIASKWKWNCARQCRSDDTFLLGGAEPREVSFDCDMKKEQVEFKPHPVEAKTWKLTFKNWF